jgi:hypothetical protein
MTVQIPLIATLDRNERPGPQIPLVAIGVLVLPFAGSFPQAGEVVGHPYSGGRGCRRNSAQRFRRVLQWEQQQPAAELCRYRDGHLRRPVPFDHRNDYRAVGKWTVDHPAR